MKETMTKDVTTMTPEEIEAAVANAEASASEAKKGKAKVKKPRIIKVTAIVPEGAKPGDEFTFDYEIPAGQTRVGVNAGIPVEEMTEDQLRIERRNAHSVWYKANKKDPNSDGTAKAKARLEKVEAIMADKGIAISVRNTAVDANTVAELIKAGKIDLEALNALLNPQA